MSVTPLSAARNGKGRSRRSTATANFGSGRREGHDASAFYERFVAPEVSDDATIGSPEDVDVIYKASRGIPLSNQHAFAGGGR